MSLHEANHLNLLALGIGGAPPFYISARRFNRRNGAGLEPLTSYGAAVRVQAYDGFVVMLIHVFWVTNKIMSSKGV